LSLSNVRRGVTQAAILGYWLGLPFVRKGYMSAAVAASVSYAFEDLHLHRLEAATMPNNAASIRVLERNGFRREGIARRLLKINGAWEDHVLHALIAEDVGTAQSSAAEVRPA
jgi:[ribosomal protein S5]-alanine N-acetyltransferase